MTSKMPHPLSDKNKLKTEYDVRRPLYERLAINLQQALKTFLSNPYIPHLEIAYRIKDFESAFEKIDRKGYQQPLTQIEDWCGLRVICYYPSDVKKICEIIEREFDVHEEEDKANRLEPHEFGYRSTHFIVQVNSSWTQAPNYRGLGNIKAEIQVRTILMHAWAEIEHKLAYKSAEQVPDRFRRNLYRLSAKFEEADEQFDELREGLSEYRDQLRSSVQDDGEFSEALELNLDTLQAFLNYHFPNRKKNIAGTRELLEELRSLGFSMGDIVSVYQSTKNHLLDMEADYLASVPSAFISQVGALRLLLNLKNKKYHAFRMEKTKNSPNFEIQKALIIKWRGRIDSDEKG